MADETCIVCLGELNTLSVANEQSIAASNSKQPITAALQIPENPLSAQSDNTSELIANLLPCGHFLHDDCLKPWVERANSCPICRATFNMVELRTALGGPVVSSYAVQDKRQVAELDPTLVVEEDLLEDIDGHEEPCMVCESYGDESELLLCDGCNNTTHVCCAGLDGIPAGAWFCYTCQEDPQILAQNVRTRRSPGGRRQNRRRGRELGWERVWRSVFDQLNFDLEFPFDEEEHTLSNPQRVQAERREFQEWRRRFDVAARQGAATRFRNTATILQNSETCRPQPESQEEIRAWNAFEKARMLEDGQEEQPRNRRKRKSRSRSNTPREATPPPTERKLKRPRHGNRRPPPIAEASMSVGESSRAPAARVSISAPTPERPRQQADAAAVNPTFLQSLLSEVEAHPAPSGSDIDAFNDYEDVTSGPERSPSPQISSPEVSPAASNHPSPRSMTPPPHSPITRPVSPPPLASTITPVFPPAPEFSPFSPVEDSIERARSRQRKQAPRQTSNSPGQSPSQSPSRAPMSYEMKQEVQKMVSTALKPHYNRKEISKDQYTDINRDISRMLYEKVWDAGGLIDQSARERWQKVAVEEVANVVKNATPAKDAASAEQNSSQVAMRPAAVKA